jgi:uncharacterized protein YdaU (DUF1376 family)
MNGVFRRGLPYIPWYPSRFLSSTRGWPVTAKGIYRELLDSQWELDGLPANPLDLQKLIGATSAEWRFWRSHVETKFPIEQDGQRRNQALEDIRQASLRHRERNRAGADKTNAKRWGPSKIIPFPTDGDAK